MRHSYIIASVVLLTAIAAVLTIRVATGHLVEARATAQPISIMEMMSKAKNLPVQAYDAI
jgi:hypothetical protein